MTWQDFQKALNYRDAEKCCFTCKYGAPTYGGECDCNHPLVENEMLHGGMSFGVCNAWEKSGGEK